jgi:molecular chaperone DnaK
MKTIGIDLGTTNSVAASAADGGRARVLHTHAGESFTPSVVGSGPKQLLVGREALNNAEAAPADTIFSVKRLMGRAYDDSQTNIVRNHYGYGLAPAGEANDRGVRVLINGKRYKPEEISAMILRCIVDDAKAELKDDVKYAVITVPAYFSEPQRAATRDAGIQAGLIIKKIIDEPTAAAIAFEVNQGGENHRMLVFDMGGGTLDISILTIVDGDFVVESLTGDMWLGGDDLDKVIVDMVVEWTKENYGIDPSNDLHFRIVARRAAENAKRRLSEQEVVDLVIPAAFSTPSGVGEVNMAIKREEFEKGIQPFIERANGLIDEALNKKTYTPENITTVLLVGGSTYIPMVRRMLEGKFGVEKILKTVNPMDAVALGAAILAERLEGVVCPKCKIINSYDVSQCKSCNTSLSAAASAGVSLTESTERNFGIAVRDREKNDSDVFSVIIPQGTPYPLEKPERERYQAVGRKITIPVYAGGSKKASENEYLGLVEIDLPQDVPEKTPVWVGFNYDRNRILTVQVDVEGREDLKFSDLEPQREVLAPNKPGFDQWQNELQSSIKFAQTALDRYGEFIDKSEKQEIKDAMEQAESALHGSNASDGQNELNKLLKLLDSLKIASRLLVVESLMSQVKPEQGSQLAEQAKQLKDAYRNQEKIKLERVQNELEANLLEIIQALPGGQDLSARSILELFKTTSAG